MIDTDLQRAQMLEAIGVSRVDALERLDDPGDPRLVALPELRLVVQGGTPDELLPGLIAALSRRFSAVPANELWRDLLRVLKKSLGNAFKWGNLRDPEKPIRVEVWLTLLGAVLAVTDEGAGFDVGLVVVAFARGREYFKHGGSGFSTFRKARSHVSWCDGGRTLLLLYVDPPSAQAPGRERELARAADVEHMLPLLARLPRFAGVELVGCGVDAAGKPRAARGLWVRIRVETRGASGARGESELAGYLLPEGEAARYSTVVGRLRAAADAPGLVRIPEPLGSFEDPPLAVFDLAPTADLGARLAAMADPSEVLAILAALGERLAALHRSRVDLERVGPEGRTEGLRALAGRVGAALRASPERGGRAGRWLDALCARGTALSPCELAPVHGALAFTEILSSDGVFHLHGLGDARLSHPGLDVGAVLAELRRLFRLKGRTGPDLEAAAREAFLGAYFAGASPAWRNDLGFFEARALAQHLERLAHRPREKWERKIDALLDQCEAALPPEG